MSELSPQDWENFLAGFPEAHILQTSAWADLKSAFGWTAGHVACVGCEGGRSIGAQVLFRKLPLGFSFAYIAKGPVSFSADEFNPQAWTPLWSEVDRLCKRERAIFLKVETDRWETVGDPTAYRAAVPDGFLPGKHSIQPRQTLVIDLRGSEEQVLGRMKQKTRYNIRLAQKKGVIVGPSQDLEGFYRLMSLTGERDLFGVHSPEYYRRAYDLFHPSGSCVMLMAEYGGQAIGALMAFKRGSRAWYFYGASSNEQRERMPTYLLQWEAMRWARLQGCATYDLWGIPEADEQTLETNFTTRSDGLWGVYRFKRGFGGQLMRAEATWDRIYQPLLYRLYLWRYANRAQD